MSADATLRAYWCRIPSRPNFGDALTPWLVKRLAGHYPRFAMPTEPAQKYFVCGSIVASAGARCIVWGSGLMNADDHVSAAAQFVAVRGPRTRARAIACGAECPDVMGDPALLLPRLYTPQGGQQRRVGFVAHFSDRPRLDPRTMSSRGLYLIDIQQQTEDVINEIAACEWVISSSLHGLIVAHAYGVPAVWVSLRRLPSGDGSKFADHYEALGAAVPEPHHVAAIDSIDLRALEKLAWCPTKIDTEALWRCCPFRRHDR